MRKNLLIPARDGTLFNMRNAPFLPGLGAQAFTDRAVHWKGAAQPCIKDGTRTATREQWNAATKINDESTPDFVTTNFARIRKKHVNRLRLRT
jgi:hypothetical protein